MSERKDTRSELDGNLGRKTYRGSRDTPPEISTPHYGVIPDKAARSTTLPPSLLSPHHPQLPRPPSTTSNNNVNTMSSPASRRSLSTADWPIDPALENSQPSQPSPLPSPPRRITRSSQATLEASQPPPESQNEKEDEIIEIVSGPGPRRHRGGSASQSRRRPRSSSLEDNGADVINPPEPKRRKTAEERQRSYAQGWETRRENLWAERILPTYSTGKSALRPIPPSSPSRTVTWTADVN